MKVFFNDLLKVFEKLEDRCSNHPARMNEVKGVKLAYLIQLTNFQTKYEILFGDAIDNIQYIIQQYRFQTSLTRKYYDEALALKTIIFNKKGIPDETMNNFPVEDSVF